MRKITPILFLLLLYFTSWGQPEKDNLISRLDKAAGAKKVDLLIELSRAYGDSSNFSQAIDFANQAVELSEQIKYNKGKIDANNLLAGNYLRSGQIDEGIKLARQTLRLANESDYKRGTAASYENIGIYLIYTGKRKSALDTLSIASQIFYDIKDSTSYAASLVATGMAYSYLSETEKAIEVYEKALQYFGEADSFHCAVIYLNLSSIHSGMTGNNEKALKYALIALKEFEKVQQKTYLAYCLGNMGSIYDNMGNYDKSIESYKKGLDIVQKSGNKYLVSNFLNNIGEEYKKQKDYTTAKDYYQKSYTINKEIKYTEGIAVTLNNLGECDYFGGSYSSALDKYKESYEILKQLDDKFKMANSLNNIASAHFKLGDYKLAAANAEEAIDLGKHFSAINEVQNGYHTLYLISQQKKDYKNALEYFTKYETLKDSLIRANLNDKVAELQSKYESEQNEKQIALLTQEQKLSDAELTRQQIITYFLIIIVFLVLIIAYMLYKKSSEREKINNELQEINKTKDSFFSIIAHDLKGPFNSLLGISEILAEEAEDFSTEEVKTFAGELNINAKNTYMLLENLLQWASNQTGKFDFNPGKVDLNEILDRNINLYQSMAQNKRIKLEVNNAEAPLINADKNMVDTIVRNILNNAIKFTKEDGVIKAATETTDTTVSITIEDNGVGMNKKNVASLFKIDGGVKTRGTNNEQGTGLGLILTKQFLDQNNGEIKVTSEVDKGTTFRVTFQKYTK